VTIHCAHCDEPLEGRRRSFCDDACRAAAYRRRKAGLAENFNAGNGRRGRVALAELTRPEQMTAQLMSEEFDAMAQLLEERVNGREPS
jgi:hypothetical protein